MDVSSKHVLIDLKPGTPFSSIPHANFFQSENCWAKSGPLVLTTRRFFVKAT